MNRKQRRKVAKATGNPAWRKVGPMQDPVKLYNALSKFKETVTGIETELSAHVERLRASVEASKESAE